MNKGKLESASGQVNETVAAGVDRALETVSGADFEALREELSKLAQRVGELAQERAGSARVQVADAVSAAAENVAKSAAAGQEKLSSLEESLEEWTRKNPVAAIAIAFGAGVVMGKIASSSRE